MGVPSAVMARFRATAEVEHPGAPERSRTATPRTVDTPILGPRRRRRPPLGRVVAGATVDRLGVQALAIQTRDILVLGPRSG